MLALLAYATFLGHPQATPNSLTFDLKACRLDKALEQISPKFGKRLVCDGKLASSTVMISVHGVTSADLMARLAKATTGYWESSADGYILAHDQKAIEAKQKAEIAASAQQYAKSLAMLKKKVEGERPISEGEASRLVDRLKQFDQGYNSADAQAQQKAYGLLEVAKNDLPSQHALERIVATIDPTVLATIPRGETLFSNDPTKMELPLHFDASVLKQLSTDHDTWLKAMSSEATFGQEPTSLTTDPRHYKEWMDPLKTRVLVGVSKSSDADWRPHVIAFFLDKDGVVSNFAEMEMPGVGFPAAPAQEAPSDTKTIIQIDPKNEAHMRAVVDQRSGLPTEAVNDDTLKMILDPAKFEPLSFEVSDAITGAAKIDNLNLIACLPDEACNLSWVVGGDEGKKCTADRVWRSLRQSGCEVERQDGWATVSLSTWKEPMNRSRLGILLRAVNTNAFIPFELAATFQASEGFDNVPGLLYQDLNAVLPGVTNVNMPFGEALRFYGLMTPEQRAALKQGGSLHLEQLSASAKANLTHLVYQGGNSLQVHEVYSRTAQAPPKMGMRLSFKAAESLPNGLTSAVSITESPTERWGAIIQTDSNQSYLALRTLDTYNLAFSLLHDTLPEVGRYDSLRGTKPVKYLPGKRINLDLTFNLSPDVEGQLYLDASEFSLRGKFLTFAELPAEFKTQLQTDMENIKKQYSKDKPSQSGTTGAPPRR